MDALAWASHGKALFVVSWISTGDWILYVSPDGEARELRETSGNWFDKPLPSPNGLYLAYAEISSDSNAWMIENFPQSADRKAPQRASLAGQSTSTPMCDAPGSSTVLTRKR